MIGHLYNELNIQFIYEVRFEMKREPLRLRATKKIPKIRGVVIEPRVGARVCSLRPSSEAW